MTARLYTTVYAPNDLPTEEAHIVSKSLGTVDEWTELEYTVHEHGTGKFKGKINRHLAQAALLEQDRYLLVHTDAGVVGGTFLDGAPIDLSAAEGSGDEWMEWVGRSQLAYLERGMMDDTSNIAGGHAPIDGYWDLDSQGIMAGASNAHPIPMYKRAIVEMLLNSPSGIDEVDHSSFDYDLDSNGAAVPFLDGEAQGADVGDDGLTLLIRMDQLGGVVWELTYLFKLNAYLTHGTDRSGAFGAGTVRLEKGVNAAKAIARNVRGSVYVSHCLVGGAEFSYREVVDPDWSAGEVVRWGFLAVPEASDSTQLDAAGLAHIERRKRQTDAWEIPLHDHGDDPVNGIYEPAPDIADGHFWLGDTITHHTGSGPYDSNEETTPVSSITWRLKTGKDANGDYVVIVGIGSTFNWSAAAASSTVAGSQHTIRFCENIACEDLTAADLISHPATNGDAEDTSGGQFTGGGYLTSRRHAGARSYGVASASSATLAYAFDPLFTFFKGRRYVTEHWGHEDGGGSVTASIKFGVAGVDETVEWSEPTSELGADGQLWILHRSCWIPTADRTGVRVEWAETQVGPGHIVMDDLVLYTAANVGTVSRAQRCDHLDALPLIPAANVPFDGTASGSDADDVQERLDELASGGTLTVEELDAAPTVAPVNTIRFPNGSVTDDGGGQVTIDLADSVHAHEPPTPGMHKILVKRTTDLSVSASNDSVPDYDTVIEDTMSDSWFDAGDPDGFLVTADYDGLDAIFTAKGAVSDPNTSEYLECKIYFFPAASGRNRPIHASTDEDYLLKVEQQPATDGVNHFIGAITDPITVHTGDRIFAVWRTLTAQTLITYNGRVSITFGAYIAASPGEQGPAGEGVPIGGTAGQVLTKVSGTDFDTSWQDAATNPADDTQVWMPLTTRVGGDLVLVADGDDGGLIPTLVPLS